jgi:hypothetical protein
MEIGAEVASGCDGEGDADDTLDDDDESGSRSPASIKWQ